MTFTIFLTGFCAGGFVGLCLGYAIRCDNQRNERADIIEPAPLTEPPNNGVWFTCSESKSPDTPTPQVELKEQPPCINWQRPGASSRSISRRRRWH